MKSAPVYPPDCVAAVALVGVMVLVNWLLKRNWPRGNSFPTCGKWLIRYSPPMRSECLPLTHEKLSTNWKYLLSIWNGLLVGLPKLVRFWDRLMLGIPQEFGSVTFTGTPSSASTSRLPANC